MIRANKNIERKYKSGGESESESDDDDEEESSDDEGETKREDIGVWEQKDFTEGTTVTSVVVKAPYKGKAWTLEVHLKDLRHNTINKSTKDIQKFYKSLPTKDKTRCMHNACTYPETQLTKDQKQNKIIMNRFFFKFFQLVSNKILSEPARLAFRTFFAHAFEGATKLKVITVDATLKDQEEEEEKLKEGEQVEGRHSGQAMWYGGKVAVVCGGGFYDLVYDDGDKEQKVSRYRIRRKGDTAPDEFEEGEEVDSKHDGGETYYAAKIAKVNDDGSYDILYHDGDEESLVARGMLEGKYRADEDVADKPETSAGAPMTPKIHIDVLACLALKAADKFSKNDSFVTLTLEGKAAQEPICIMTTPIVISNSPMWEEGTASYDMEFDSTLAKEGGLTLRAAVFDKDVLGSDFLGEAIFSSEMLLKFDGIAAGQTPSTLKDKPAPEVHPLKENPSRSPKYVGGSIQLRIYCWGGYDPVTHFDADNISGSFKVPDGVAAYCVEVSI
jgi:hypothetical protein